jgi:hypothetical protein
MIPFSPAVIIIIITFTREGPAGFHQPRQIAPREGPRVLVATLQSRLVPCNVCLVALPAVAEQD